MSGMSARSASLSRFLLWVCFLILGIALLNADDDSTDANDFAVVQGQALLSGSPQDQATGLL